MLLKCSLVAGAALGRQWQQVCQLERPTLDALLDNTYIKKNKTKKKNLATLLRQTPATFEMMNKDKDI